MLGKAHNFPHCHHHSQKEDHIRVGGQDGLPDNRVADLQLVYYPTGLFRNGGVMALQKKGIRLWTWSFSE